MITDCLRLVIVLFKQHILCIEVCQQGWYKSEMAFPQLRLPLYYLGKTQPTYLF